MNDTIKLTQYSHGGGCGCKIAPAVLAEMLAALPIPPSYPNLMVGTESSDDAAVYKLNESQAVVVTTDFFMPIVDDARDFGRIAATNAISDVYAMGATPILALAVAGHAHQQAAAGHHTRHSCRRRFGVRSGGHTVGGRPFHRCARADLRPGCRGRGASGPHQTQ